MKLTFECKESLYKWLCDTEEYLRSTEHLRKRKYESLDQVINLLIDRGLAWLSLYEEAPDFTTYLGRRWGAEVRINDAGNIEMFFPEKPEEE